MPDRHNEEQIIQSIKDGDVEAFGVLYERYADMIFRFVYAHLDDRFDAEDLSEDIFVRVWKALPDYDERGLPFSAFLFKIARNTVIDYYRKKKPVQSIEDMELHSHEPAPEDVIDSKMEQDHIRKAIEELQETYRTVLVFRFLSGMSTEETAVIMQRSVGAVRVLQHRALSALKQKLVKGSHV